MERLVTDSLAYGEHSGLWLAKTLLVHSLFQDGVELIVLSLLGLLRLQGRNAGETGSLSVSRGEPGIPGVSRCGMDIPRVTEKVFWRKLCTLI